MLDDNNFLDILKGEKLSSVTFVMDYLQIDFDGNRFTLNVWPDVNIDNRICRFGDPSYRDNFCLLIGKVVSNVSFKTDESLIFNFSDNANLSLSLDPDNSEINSPEIFTFNDVNNKFYVF